ncbi:MAG: site-specific integrase [Pseudomonadota bacterium]|nr:site-specific integrase [Pseudomonadota bacterium]
MEAILIRAMERYPLAAVGLAALSAATFAQFRDAREKEVTGSTVLRDLQILSAVMNHARREWGISIANFVSDLRRPTANQGRKRTIDEAEEARLLHALECGGRGADGCYLPGTRNPWLHALVVIAIETGMRRGEMLALRREHVDLRKRVAQVVMSKNGEARTVPLSQRAARTLESVPAHISGRIFPLTGNAVRKSFERARALAGLDDVHFHDLRHTATTRLARRLPNVIELAAVTGHKDLKMLQRYYHPDAEDLARKLG